MSTPFIPRLRAEGILNECASCRINRRMMNIGFSTGVLPESRKPTKWEMTKTSLDYDMNDDRKVIQLHCEDTDRKVV